MKMDQVRRLAIDFGTTNSVLAGWDDEAQASTVLPLSAISSLSSDQAVPLIPSLLYVHDAANQHFSIGQAVRQAGLDQVTGNRLFRNFKRGIVTSLKVAPRQIDGTAFDDQDAGRAFLQQVLRALPCPLSNLEELVLTAPVAAFEGYLTWLNEALSDVDSEKIRVVDESTAAALGYAVTEPGAIVLVFDFGGGTLDLSLVQLPESPQKTGGFLKKLLRGGAAQQTARVIAKAGRVIGGSDIDQWMLAEVLRRLQLSPAGLGTAYPQALTQCEAAKITLSTQETAEIRFAIEERSFQVDFTRGELENLLQAEGFFDALRHVVDKVMAVAHQGGIYREDIRYVLLVGGTSLMPSVQHTLADYFSDMAIRSDKPFSAVAEGAVQLSMGYGLQDYLAHGYGLRYLDDQGQHAWDELISIGSPYPITRPIELDLEAAHSGQHEVEFLIGEIDSDAVHMVEVRYEDGQAVFVARMGQEEQHIVPVNEPQALQLLARLNPAGTPGEARLKAYFTVDERRRLRLTVLDLLNQRELLSNVVLATLH